MSVALRVADVIRDCWSTYSRKALPPHVAKAAQHILSCRTKALGGHIHCCDQCGGEVPVYNSCQSRHCPTCQTSAKEKWLDARSAELLPVQYFHVVFTLPHALNALIDANRRLLLGELFSVTNWVLQRFAQDPQWRLEGELGFLAVLHTWSQKIRKHFHVHCIVPGGVWRAETREWIPCRGKWLFRKESLADAFRNRFIRRLRALRKRGKLAYGGRAAALADEQAWEALLKPLEGKSWVVYPKATASTPKKALEYLGRYTHKVAISDHRIKCLENGEVTYSWRDRSDDNAEKLDTIPIEEFTKRFLAHILPDGFHKIRYYGWMAGTKRKDSLTNIREAIGAPPPEPPPEETLDERILRRTGIDIRKCPHCGKGRLNKTDRRLFSVKARAP